MSEKIVEMIDQLFIRNREEKGENTYIKAICTGHIIEIYEYEKMPRIPSGKQQLDSNDLDLDIEVDSEEKKIFNRKNNMHRARNKLRRLISANFDENSKFITLTFRDNLTSVRLANNEFKKFIQRMRYRYNNFKYIAVIEFQKRGAVHYHMISNLPYIANNELADIWRNGYVKINNIEHVDNVGAYMIKYMTKDVFDERLHGLKSYQTSKGLIRPVEFVGDEVERIIDLYNLKDIKKVFSSAYKTEHLGYVTYKEYNLKRL